MKKLFKGLLFTILIAVVLSLTTTAQALTRSLFDEVKSVSAMYPVVVTGDLSGITVDVKGADSVMFLINVGIEGDTLSGSVYMEYIIQGSADDSTWAAVTTGTVSTATNSSGIIATVDADAEIPAVFNVSFTALTYRYYRIYIDTTGSHSTGTPHAISAILYRWNVLPITND